MKPMHNLKYLKPYRNQLRNNATSAEAMLWTFLSNKKVGGFKFRRQHSIDKYIVDFYCPALKLAIELDGQIHEQPAIIEHDLERTQILHKFDIHILRFENRMVFENTEHIIEEILQYAHNSPPYQGGGYFGLNSATYFGVFVPVISV